MGNNTRRNFFGKISAMAAFLTSARLFAQQTPVANPGVLAPAPNPGTDAPRRSGGHHIEDGIYYISGTGANDGYPKDDHVLVTDPFEKHVTRTMEALKKSVERAGSTRAGRAHAACCGGRDPPRESQQFSPAVELGSERSRRLLALFPEHGIGLVIDLCLLRRRQPTRVVRLRGAGLGIARVGLVFDGITAAG